jgi:hypothetical protein
MAPRSSLRQSGPETCEWYRTLDRVTGTHGQLDLAIEQLEIALDVFLDGTSYVSSLTLSGAAEEILRKEAELSGKGSLLKEELEVANYLQKIWPGGETKWKDFIKNKNSARNSAKHLNDQRILIADMEEGACWMLVRALANRRLLNIAS